MRLKIMRQQQSWKKQEISPEILAQNEKLAMHVLKAVIVNIQSKPPARPHLHPSRNISLSTDWLRWFGGSAFSALTLSSNNVKEREKDFLLRSPGCSH